MDAPANGTWTTALLALPNLDGSPGDELLVCCETAKPPANDGGAVEVNIGGEIVAAGMSVAPLFDPSGARMRQPQLVQARSKVM